MEPAWSGPHAPGHFSALQGWQGLVREPPVGAHILHIYEDPDREIEAASLFVIEGARRAERVCCVGGPRKLASIRRRVEEAGLDADRLVRDGALALVRQLDLNGGPKDDDETSRTALDRFIHAMFRGVPERYPSVRWWGNRVARFFENGRFDRALAFEQLCHERREVLPWSLLCAYDGRKQSSRNASGPRENTMEELGVHGHWVDFSDAASEARRAMAFVKRGLARGAKVVALLPSSDMEVYREEAVLSGHEEDIEHGRLSLFNADEHLNVLKTAGVLAVLLLAIQGMIQVARGQGYSEVWFIGKIASSLLASSPPYQALALRVESAMDSLVRTLPISFYCPMPYRFPGDPSLVADLLSGHGWSSVAELALGSFGH